MTTHDIGHKLWHLRQQRGVSQLQLFELSGVAIKTISDIETGRTNPRLSTLNQIAIGLGAQLTIEFTAESQ